MMSKSKPVFEKQIVNQLETANQALPENTKADIAYARRRALLEAAGNAKNNTRLTGRVSSRLFARHLQWATPVALAALVTLYVSYTPSHIPELPAELFEDDIPTVNVALLQDLEFANWLAEQDDEALL